MVRNQLSKPADAVLHCNSFFIWRFGGWVNFNELGEYRFDRIESGTDIFVVIPLYSCVCSLPTSPEKSSSWSTSMAN